MLDEPAVENETGDTGEDDVTAEPDEYERVPDRGTPLFERGAVDVLLPTEAEEEPVTAPAVLGEDVYGPYGYGCGA